MDHLLSWIIFLPTIGALLCLLLPKPLLRWTAVTTTAVTFLVSLLLFNSFWGGSVDGAASADVFGSSYGFLHHVERANWIQTEGFRIEYFLGVDGLSFPLVVLTTFIGLLACLASWNLERWKINRGARRTSCSFCCSRRACSACSSRSTSSCSTSSGK
jgi:NADH-quinone oxidoreductase subunit M